MWNNIFFPRVLYLIRMHQQQSTFVDWQRSFSRSSLICTEAERFLGSETTKTATAVCSANSVCFESWNTVYLKNWNNLNLCELYSAFLKKRKNERKEWGLLFCLAAIFFPGYWIFLLWEMTSYMLSFQGWKLYWNYEISCLFPRKYCSKASPSFTSLA